MKKRTEKPIIFSGGHVKLILAGLKTQTRRVCDPELWDLLEKIRRVNGRPTWHCLDFDVKCPYDVERLWVKETWTICAEDGGVYKSIPKEKPPHLGVEYKADGHDLSLWHSGRYMPRWASRLTLKVNKVGVQKLQDISEDEAIAEGVPPDAGAFEDNGCVNVYREVWDKINAKRGFGWNVNPWVWVVKFSLLNDESTRKWIEFTKKSRDKALRENPY